MQWVERTGLFLTIVLTLALAGTARGERASLTDLAVQVGFAPDESLQSLAFSDDHPLLVLSGSSMSPRTVVRAGLRTDVDVPDTLDLTIETSSNRTGTTAIVSLRNWMSSSFDVVAVYGVSPQDSVRTVPGLSAESYARSTDGRIEVRVEHVAAVVPGPWPGGLHPAGLRSWHDLVRVDVIPDPHRNAVEPPEAPPASPCTGGGGCDGDFHRHGPGHSIYLFSGEFYLEPVDLRIKGRGLDIVWARRYRSKIGAVTPMGVGWDHSYNIYLKEFGLDLLLHDGNSRRDVFFLQPDGTYARDEFFIEGTKNQDGTLTFTWPDAGTWNFHPFDGSSQEGKIASIVDRNGNTIRFEYDATGRLMTIIDTLNRSITLAYNGSGRIESVSDFAGRVVRYTYYEDGDAGGSSGDLESMTTPAVTGTPNGNDFPSGKTTVYTYTKGMADERLDHNLVTITDPKGQTFLINEYAGITDPEALDFDRVTRQIWGDPGDVLDFFYATRNPLPSNQFAVIIAIANDRVGNVSEHLFDGRNRLVIDRDLTGRADPDLPTTLVDNRPTFPLRPSDPPSFETRFAYNDDSLPTQIVQPEGNSVVKVYELALDPLAPRRMRGNLRERHSLPGPRGGSQMEISEFFVYETGLGGCCGVNFVSQYFDARGYETLHEYDSAGNRTRTTHSIPSVVEDWEYNEFGQVTAHIWPTNGDVTRRRDEHTYYSTGPQAGYLHERIVDASNLALTTTYEYDMVGNLIREIDPRGNDQMRAINQLDEVVRVTSREVTLPAGLVRYEWDTYYDPNGNVVRIDTENFDDQGLAGANTHFTKTQEYDILDHPVRQTVEVEEGYDVVTEFEYDANRNRTKIRNGEAVSGAQPQNTVTFLYDERDLLFRTIRAEGNANQSTEQVDYDGNGNPVVTWEGLEGTPRIHAYAFDGFDRSVAHVDPMGNVRTYDYDPNGNLVHLQVDGELLDLPGSAGNVRLFEVVYVYDSLDRRTRTEVAYFDPETQTPIGDGSSITEIVYSDASKITTIRNDNGNETSYAYDTAHRRLTISDALGNTQTFGYDANSNVTSVSIVEKSDAGSPDQTSVTTYAHDGLDRRTEIVDNLGNTTRYGYDSRDLRSLRVDALGNETRYVYDGLRRLTMTIRDMDSDGADASDPADIVTFCDWDDSSRIVLQTDDNGNMTTFDHDPLDRLISSTYADGKMRVLAYDVHDSLTMSIDANGSIVTYSHDLDDRLTGKTVIPGPGVSSDTTFESLEYDGLDRIVTASDNDSVLLRSYNSLGLLVTEVLNGETTTREHDGVGNILRRTFPGGRSIETTYDALDRKKTITDAGTGPIATYDYIGPFRVERRHLGNDVESSLMYDGARRVVRTTHTFDPDGAGTILDDRSYAWDAVHDKVSRTDLRPGGAHYDYEYDARYRLVRATKTIDQDPHAIEYDLDGVGNRLTVSGGPNPGSYSMDPSVPEPADSQMNQYTHTPGEMRTYDANGNLTSIDVSGLLKTISYDYRNQMVEYQDAASGVMASYRYDALGRRIQRIVNDGTTKTLHYFYDGNRLCEEYDEGAGIRTTYVQGLYIDELLNMRRDGTDTFFLGDDLHNVTAAVDSMGAVVERYEYGVFGAPAFFDGSGTPIAESAIRNPYLFTGRRYDPETGWYYYRARYLDPVAGRFISRDPIGIWGDGANLGNGYAYAGNNPWTTVDPFGLVTIKNCGGSSRENEILDAHEEAKNISKAAYDYIDDNWGNLGADTLYQRWFGSFTNDRASEVRSTLYDTKFHLRYTDWTFKCNNGCTLYARVPLQTIVGTSNKITLCRKFWRISKATGVNSKPGVLIHEVTHLWRAGTTGDKAYGTAKCMSLASSKPDKAVNNADSYEYFAEDLAYGIVSSGSSGGTSSSSTSGKSEYDSCLEKYGSAASYKCQSYLGLSADTKSGVYATEYALNEEYIDIQESIGVNDRIQE